jgi:hypothetical protein
VAVSPPTSIEFLGPQVASSPAGAAAVAFNEVDLDAQARASAFLALASPRGPFTAARAVPGVQEILALAFSGSTLELLAASGPPGQPCCSTAEVIRRRARTGFGPAQRIVADVGGGATGRLVPLSDGRILAVIAGPQRLWVTEARGSGPFARARGLTRPGSAPAALAATGTAGGGSAVVWTQGSGQSVMEASAAPGATPSRPRTLLTVASGHAVDDLQLAPQASGLTLAWTESWNDPAGVYHAQAVAADLSGRARARVLSPPGAVASSLALASDGGGEEVAAWEACSPSSPACAVQSRVRRGRAASARPGRGGSRRARSGWFGPLTRLGQIDAGQSPQLAMASNRRSLLGWISGGRVYLAGMTPGARRFGVPRQQLSGENADNLDLGFGPTGEAIATWTQGTSAPAVFASRSG